MTKQTKWVCAQRRLRSAWASAQSDQSSLSAWRKLGSLATHWAHSEDSDQTGRMPRLIWVFAGCTLILLVLSYRGSFKVFKKTIDPDQKPQSAVFDLDLIYYMYLSHVTRKPVFGVCDQVRLKQACSVTETSSRLEILDIESRGIILSKQQTTKVLIRLRDCAGWSAPLLFAYGINRFSHDAAHLKLTSTKFWEWKGQLLQFCLEEKQNVCLKIFW